MKMQYVIVREGKASAKGETRLQKTVLAWSFSMSDPRQASLFGGNVVRSFSAKTSRLQL